MLAGLLLLSSTPVEAGQARLRLVYERQGPEANRCAPPEALVIALRETLGYDPTDFRARELLRVTLSVSPSSRSKKGKGKGRLRARIEWLDGDGQRVGERVLESPVGRCKALLQNAALAIALALDPEAVEAVQAGTRAVKRPRRSALAGPVSLTRAGLELELPARAEPPPPDEEADALRGHVGISLLGMFGLEAEPGGLGGALEVGLGLGMWSGYLRAHLSAIWTQDVDATTRYRLMTPMVELGGCAGVSVLDVCAFAAVGAAIATGEGEGQVETTRSGLTGLAGLRVLAEVPVDGVVRPTVELTVGVPLARSRVVIADREVFRSWPVVLAFGLGLRIVVF